MGVTTKDDYRTMGESRKTEDSPVPFEEALTKTGNGRYNILLACTCAFILLAIATDLFGFSLVVTAACDLDLSVSQKGILTSLPFIGIILVSFLWGYVSDTRGRRFTLVITLPLGFLFSCISSLCSNWLMLALFKFFSVCFSCAANSVTYTLMGESCTQRARSRYMLLMTSLLLMGPAMGGILAYPTLTYLDFAAEVSWLGLVFRPWRLLIIVLAAPCGIGALGILFFYESPKFLANWGRKDEALEVLKSMYAINHRCHRDEYKVRSISLDESSGKKATTLWRSIVEQSAPLFRPPLLLRTLQLFYIVAVVYITNNSFLVWLPHIMNLIRISLDMNVSGNTNVCSIISLHTTGTNFLNETFEDTGNATTPIMATSPEICTGTIADNVTLTLIASQSVFAFLNFIISYLQNYRKVVLITILISSAASGVALDLVPDAISSVFFFVVFTGTCLGMGIMASYFVELYPTSYRGMISSLSILVARSSAFVGINLVAHLIFDHCQLTFYLWSLLILSSAVAAMFLPPDKPPVQSTKL